MTLLLAKVVEVDNCPSGILILSKRDRTRGIIG